jgi:HD-GYP domain-containing protein (c-di-GMP phosphodiesterase class II)
MPRVDDQPDASERQQTAETVEFQRPHSPRGERPLGRADDGNQADGALDLPPAVPGGLWLRRTGNAVSPPAPGPATSEHAGLALIPESFFLAIMEAVEAREPFAKGRARNVARYAAALAEALLPAEEVNATRIGALLSDIGMLSVAEAILQKTDTLTPEEQQTVRMHPVFGAEILMNVPQLKSIVPLVLHHHEDYNGGGYPYGLSGEWIPYGARIIRVVDAYDALTSLRPYRAAYSPAEALNILSTGAEVQFDPRIVTAFRLILRRGPIQDDVLDRWSDLRNAARVKPGPGVVAGR